MESNILGVSGVPIDVEELKRKQEKLTERHMEIGTRLFVAFSKDMNTLTQAFNLEERRERFYKYADLAFEGASILLEKYGYSTGQVKR